MFTLLSVFMQEIKMVLHQAIWGFEERRKVRENRKKNFFVL